LKINSSLRLALRNVHKWWLWCRREQAFRKFLQSWTSAPSEMQKSQECWVIIQPWMETPLPWFMVTLALMLRRRGRRIRLIWDDTGFGANTVFQWYVKKSLGRVLAILSRSIESVCLSSIPPADLVVIPEDKINKLVELNTIQHFRAENLAPERVSFQDVIKQNLKQTAAHLSSLLLQSRPEYLIIGGGIYSSSGVFIQLGKILGIRIASIDSGPGVILVSTNGIASHLDDIPKAIKMLPVKDDWVVVEAQAELMRRMNSQDSFAYQMTASTGRAEKIGVLLPLNQSFDTAALGRHLVFKNQMEWMLATVAWVLKHSRETIAVRRHPVERHKGYLSNDDYESALLAHFGHNPNLRYIPEDMPINTYDLIKHARVVVPYVSTVGVEAAALGKPVVTEGASYYAGLNFVWKANTRLEYFELLRRSLEGEFIQSKYQRQLAWRCYYLTQYCNFLRTAFTPQPNDFDIWAKMSLEEIFSSDEVSDLLEALDSSVPLSIIRHNRRKRHRQADE